MVKVGIIGGIGPESTILYYRGIIRRYQERMQTRDIPAFFINSINMMKMASYLNKEEFENLVEYFLPEVDNLMKAGAEFGAIASNTPHIVFNSLQERSGLKLISIVAKTCSFVKMSGFSKAALLGTKMTMSQGFYQEEAQKFDIEMITPDEEGQNIVDDIYLKELIYNEINPQSKSQIIKIINRLKEEKGVECLILGGTELSLIISQNDFRELKVFDSAEIHIESIVDKIIGE